MNLMDTPRANRLHIGLFGKRNSGKSSLINALTEQESALVSDVAGTTTDPVYKAMEVYGIGPCVFIDTAGYDDEGALGRLRVKKTEQAADKADIALLVCSDEDITEELNWLRKFQQRKTPVIVVVNKIDHMTAGTVKLLREAIRRETGDEPVMASANKREGIEKIREAIIRLLPGEGDVWSITGGLAEPGDLVLLVMPQDLQAPQGRLILPQVQTLRDLLDKNCIAVSVTTAQFPEALAQFKQPPKLIITDSQVFKTVYALKPEESKLTSFSVLFANMKGDLPFFVESAAAIDLLTEKSHILIAEACTHAPLSEDIGREKIPRLLKRRIGENLAVTVVGGADFPEDLSPYDLIIHCGGCMFNRKHILSRVARARAQNVPMSNYGVVLAYLFGILDQIDLPSFPNIHHHG